MSTININLHPIQPSSNVKKELIEIKEKQKKSADIKKRKEIARDKERQKRKLHDAINMHHHDYM